MRAAAFYASCAALGYLLGALLVTLAVQALTAEPSNAWVPSARDATDFAADVESFLRGEGY